MAGQWFSNVREATQHLQEIRMQRWDNRHRQQFVEDHQLIHNRRKHDVCIPALPGHDQEAWFEKLEDNKIFDMVFEYINHPADLTSSYFACKTFRKHVEKKRKMVFLSKAFGVLRNTWRLRYSGFQRGRYSSVEQKENSREILKLRLVAKPWKKIVEDEFLMPWYFPLRPIWHPKRWDWNSPMICLFQNIEQVNDAMGKLKNAESSAPLIRALSVKDEHQSEKERESFFAKILLFLDRHGAAVWAFSFYQEPHPVSGDLSYESLRNMLLKMSQLKALRVGNYLEDLINIEEDFQESTARLSLAIARNPFPFLPSLELVVNFAPPQYVVLVSEILTSNVNIKALVLGRSWEEFKNPIPRQVWSSLESLRLLYLSIEYSSLRKSVFIRDFLRIKQFNWRLKHLHAEYVDIYEYDDDDDDSMGSYNFFSVLNRFNKRLPEVRIRTNYLSLADHDITNEIGGPRGFANLEEIDITE